VPLLRRLFEPLGYQVSAHPLESPYFSITLQASCCLQDLLAHIYVLVPVLDNNKHYWIGDAEVDKLLRHANSWLGHHPDKDFITKRYLKYQPSLARQALARLGDERLGTVIAVLKNSQAKRVLDLGCGEGNLLRALLKDNFFEEIVGVDISSRALEIHSWFADLPRQAFIWL